MVQSRTSGLITGSNKRTEISGLTGLRFVAAMSVAIAHGSDEILKLQDTPLHLTYWLPQLAGFGMSLFFVLSGFVIHYNYRLAVTTEGLGGLFGFFWVRFARLYPLYFFVVLIDVTLGQKLSDYMAGHNNNFLDVLRALPYYLTFTQSWLYKPFGSQSLIYVTGVNSSLTWSISTEWFFYVAYPAIAFVILVFAKRPSAAIIATFCLCIFWIIFVIFIYQNEPHLDAWATEHYGAIAGLAHGTQDSFFRWIMYFSPYLRIGEFILGCLISQLYILLQDKPPGAWERFVGSALLMLGILSVPIMTYLMYHGQWAFVRMLNFNFGLAPSVAIILFCSARYDTLFSRFLNGRTVVALGEASYSIYLTHFLVFAISASFIGDVFPFTLANTVFLTLKALLLLTLILLISLGLKRYLEVPARQWLRSLWRRKWEGKTSFAAIAISVSPVAVAMLLWIAIPAAPRDSSLSVENGIRVLGATYGANCGAVRGNATDHLAKACDGKGECHYVLDVGKLGDPASGCAKNFIVEFECLPAHRRAIETVAAEAGLGSHLHLSCQ